MPPLGAYSCLTVDARSYPHTTVCNSVPLLGYLHDSTGFAHFFRIPAAAVALAALIAAMETHMIWTGFRRDFAAVTHDLVAS